MTIFSYNNQVIPNKNGDCVVADIMEIGQAATHNNSPTCSNTIKPGHHVIKIGKIRRGALLPQKGASRRAPRVLGGPYTGVE